MKILNHLLSNRKQLHCSPPSPFHALPPPFFSPPPPLHQAHPPHLFAAFKLRGSIPSLPYPLATPPALEGHAVTPRHPQRHLLSPLSRTFIRFSYPFVSRVPRSLPAAHGPNPSASSLPSSFSSLIFNHLFLYLLHCRKSSAPPGLSLSYQSASW